MKIFRNFFDKKKFNAIIVGELEKKIDEEYCSAMRVERGFGKRNYFKLTNICTRGSPVIEGNDAYFRLQPSDENVNYQITEIDLKNCEGLVLPFGRHSKFYMKNLKGKLTNKLKNPLIIFLNEDRKIKVYANDELSGLDHYNMEIASAIASCEYIFTDDAYQNLYNKLSIKPEKRKQTRKPFIREIISAIGNFKGDEI